MAAKRMFSIDVVDTDKFLDMPVSTQALYFHFGMRADDDGFVASPRKIVKIANCTNDDLKVLISKGYVIPFQSGVIVITDWKTNNFIRSDRYKATKYQEEFEQLELCNGAYSKKDVYKMDTKCMQAVSDMDTKRIPNGYQMDTQISIDKNRLDKSIYTSNMDANALNVDARTRDRIIKTSIVLQMPEENLRKKKAAAEQQSFLQMILQQQGR